jgi:hypothetical protein
MAESELAMTESEISALLDAHDALVEACMDSSLTFPEFLSAYGSFPDNYALDAHKAAHAGAVLRFFRRRIAFHSRVAATVSGFRSEDESLSVYGDAGRFIPTVGLIRLRTLVACYPDFEAEPIF